MPKSINPDDHAALARRAFALARRIDRDAAELAQIKRTLSASSYVTTYDVKPTRVRSYERRGYTARRMKRAK
jgi:hypothetical protein